jgi:peroxiredoxin
MDAEANHYNIGEYYRSINAPLRRAFRGRYLQVGDPAPEFSLELVGGGTANLADLTKHGSVALIFGCWSAPPLLQQIRECDELASAVTDHATVLLVYTREIHPNERLVEKVPGIPPHRTSEEKMEVARRFKETFSVGLGIAVDDLRGSVHQSYGMLPEYQVVVDRDGVLAHRAEWIASSQLRDVLANLEVRYELEKTGNPRMSYSETMWCTGNLSAH